MPDYNSYTVGWICAIEVELVAAMELLDEEESELVDAPANDNNSYTLGRIGKHNVVIAGLPYGQYGTTSASNIARDMVRTFPNIRVGLMVGIGGGVPTKRDIRLGDVVVSSPNRRDGGVIQYDHGKATQEQGLVINGSLNQPPISVLNAMTKLSALHRRKGHKLNQIIQEMLDKNKRLVSEFQRPPPDADKLYKADFAHAVHGKSCTAFCGESHVIQRDARSSNEDNPRIHYGLIASGNLVMKDAIIRDRLAEEEEVLCFEMEAAGLSNHFPCVLVRGICDYSDSHKNDEWQGYAAMVAAAYAKELLLQIPPEKVKAEKRIEEVLAEVREPIFETNQQVGALKQKADRHDDLKILDWLSQVDFSSQQNDFIQRHQQGTGDWFLRCEDFQSWLRTKNTTLFCPGMPGAGKTFATAVTIDYLSSRFVDDCTTGLAYIYCDYQRRNEQQAHGLLASLLRQLAQALPSLPEAVKSLYEASGHGKTKPPIQKIIYTLRAVIRLHSTTFIIIDALDEHEEAGTCGTTFLSAICSLRDDTEINLLITSRPRQSLQQKLEPCLVQEIYAHDQDVRLYVECRTAEVMVLDDSNPDLSAAEKGQLKDAIRDKVSGAVDGIFLLARFYLESLKDKTTPNQIFAALEDLRTGPEAYDDAYGKTIMRIRNQGTEHRDLARRTLTWLTFARRRLSILELRHAVSVRIGSSELSKWDLQSTNVILHVCMDLVKIDEGSDTISLLHYTTMEYMQANPGCLSSLHSPTYIDGPTISDSEKNTTGRRLGQGLITATCATYLSFTVFGVTYAKRSSEFSSRMDSHPLFHYAATNWAYHASEAELCQETMKFLSSEAHVAASSQLLPAFESAENSNSNEVTGLHLAAYFGLQREINNLLRVSTQPDVGDYSGRTPLAYAAVQGHSAVVESLLATDGVTPDLRDLHGRTPLAHSAANGCLAVVKLLLAVEGVDPDGEDDCNQTPLSHAAEAGHYDIVKLLLATDGVDPDCRDSTDRTPLSYAAELGRVSVVRLLLSTKGVNPDSGDSKWRTPLSRVAGQKDMQEECLKAMIKMLLAEESVNPNSKDSWGRTPLLHAAISGSELAIELLLENSEVDPDTKDCSGRTPLSYAAEKGIHAVKLFLARNDVDYDSRDNFGRTPLSYTGEGRGHYYIEEVTTLLLAKEGVNPDSTDDEGKTPLDHAIGNNRYLVRDLLFARARADLKRKYYLSLDE